MRWKVSYSQGMLKNNHLLITLNSRKAVSGTVLILVCETRGEAVVGVTYNFILRTVTQIIEKRIIFHL